MDFGSRIAGKPYKLEKMLANGKSIDILDLDTLQAHDVKLKTENHALLVQVTGDDPYIIFQQPLAPVKKYDRLPLFSIFVMSLIVLYGILSQAVLPLWSGSPVHKVQVLFALFIFGFIVLPLLTVRTAGNIDASENRNPNPRPHLRTNGNWNGSYGKDFEAWFNDIFGGRRQFIKIHSLAEHLLNPWAVENRRAFVGREHWLFYKGDNSVSLFQNRILFTPEEAEKIKENYLQQKKWLQQHGTSYYVLIAPNKADVYGEYYKEGIVKVRKKDRVQLLKEQLPDIPLLYPLPQLFDAKKEGLTYFKNDTHWSDWGAYQGYLVLAEQMQQDHREISPLTKDKMQITRVQHLQGDLSGMLELNNRNWYTESYLKPVPETGQHYKVVREEKGKDGNPHLLHTECPGRPFKVIVFRDSFSTALIPYLSETFGDVTYIWDHNLNLYAGLIRKEKPDIVIHEMVSRYTQSLLNETPDWRDE